MKTNELKKGNVILLSNGWLAVMADNMRGNTRMAKVYGAYTEIGSVYSHDITRYYPDYDESMISHLVNQFRYEETVPSVKIEHTPAQLKLKKQLSAMGW